MSTATLMIGSFAFLLFPASAAEDVIVEMRLMHFTPEVVEAKTGSTVVFVNKDTFDYPGISGNHRVVAQNGAFDTRNIAPGARWAQTFNEPMTTSFYCTVHPSVMQGTLTVEGPPVKPKVTERTVQVVEPKPTDPQTWGYDPTNVAVDAGGKITWRNNGATEHTVTADDGSFDKKLAPGEKVTLTFPKATAIRYSCAPHPWMKGTIKVGAAKLPPPPEPAKQPATSTPGTNVAPPPPGAGPRTFNVSAVEPDAADPMGWAFAPPALSVRVKDTIVWKNDGAQPHTVTADDGTFDADLQPGQTFSFTAEQTGSISYSCKPHPWMKGTVQILAAGTGTDAEPVAPPAPPSGGGVATPAEDRSEAAEHHGVSDPMRVSVAVTAAAAILLATAAMLFAGRVGNQVGRPRTPHSDGDGETTSGPSQPAEEHETASRTDAESKELIGV